mgnify:FL=1
MSTSMTLTSTPTNSPKASTSNLPLADCDCTTDTDPFCRVVVVVSTGVGATVALLLLFELVPTVTPSSTCGPRRYRCIFSTSLTTVGYPTELRRISRRFASPLQPRWCRLRQWCCIYPR